MPDIKLVAGTFRTLVAQIAGKHVKFGLGIQDWGAIV